MATSTVNTIFRNNSDAEFRAWASWFDGLWTTFGWTQDYSNFSTGTDWTDVTAPSAANQSRVQKIYHMGDGLANPLYVKIEYGSAGAAATPGIRLTFGSARSGSAISGVTYYDSSATHLGISSVNTNSNNHYASGAAGRFTIAFNITGTSIIGQQHWYMNIERRVNASGTPQTTGYLIGIGHTSSSKVSMGIDVGIVPNVIPTMQTPGVGSATNQVYNGKAAINPVGYSIGPTEFGLGFVSYPQGFFSAAATFSATLLGTTITYIALASSGVTVSLIPTEQTSNASYFAMRYE